MESIERKEEEEGKKRGGDVGVVIRSAAGTASSRTANHHRIRDQHPQTAERMAEGGGGCLFGPLESGRRRRVRALLLAVAELRVRTSRGKVTDGNKDAEEWDGAEQSRASLPIIG